MSKPTLWTRDFTIITLGSVVSMLGNAMTGFALSLFALDLTGSPSLYAAFVFLYTLPQIAAPAIAGPLMDRFSRRRTIYALDFFSAALYGTMGLLLRLGDLSFPVLALLAFLIGGVHSVYLVAYNSFYPLLIPPGQYEKAYSVSSTLETLSYITLPLSTILYNTVGIAPLLLANAGCFCLAALFETRISDVEKLADGGGRGGYSLASYWTDAKEGLRYLRAERGLLCIAAYYFFNFLVGGVSSVTTLPYFRANWDNGEFVYLSVHVFTFLGRIAGGAILYRFAVPRGKRHATALVMCTVTMLLESFYLYTPLTCMAALTLISGVTGMTGYNLRQASVHSYVPDDKRGRFNGVWVPLTTLGSLTGELLAGVAMTVLPMRLTLCIFSLIAVLAGLVFFGGGAKWVRPIYDPKEEG